MGDRTDARLAYSTRARSPRRFPSQDDEALRRARLADTQTVPAGQVPTEVTDAFLTLVRALNAHTDGIADVEVAVRWRGQDAGTLPVTEDTALALLSAFTSAVAVRPAPEHGRTPDTVTARPALRLIPTQGGAA